MAGDVPFYRFLIQASKLKRMDMEMQEARDKKSVPEPERAPARF
jgi:hypothetical protein